MAKRVAGVTEKLLECAKEEFLIHGYENASLRVIAERASSSKGAIYIRYSDKASLYRAVVQPVIDGFFDLFCTALGRFTSLSGEEMTQQVYHSAENFFPQIIDYIYDNYDEFKLLLTSGEHVVYQEFLHNIVSLDMACSVRYIECSKNDAIISGRLTPELNHLLSSGFYTGIFELVVHDMPKEQGISHIKRMRRFYLAGWRSIFDGDEVTNNERVD